MSGCGLMSSDSVNHPQHYTQGKYETIEVIESITGEHYRGYLVGNIIKYLTRYNLKNGLEDLEKAKWYLDELINTEEVAQRWKND